MTDNTYPLKIFCPNCDHRGFVNIPKGIPYSEFPCPNCEVINLEKEIDIQVSGGSIYNDF